MDGTLSLESDENGIAVFQYKDLTFYLIRNLTILAITYYITYIHLSCDNAFSLIWGVKRSKLYDNFNIPIFKSPIQLSFPENTFLKIEG